MRPRLPIEDILATDTAAPRHLAETIGSSRAGRPMLGYRFGSGACHISLIAGCHADEPVGPAMLDRLATWLAAEEASSAVLKDYTWTLVPHANPDGETDNAAWTSELFDSPASLATATVDLPAYLRHVERELPGDDVEFGFPREASDTGARPENRNIARYLEAGGPYHLHGSFHGMAFAAGPWFLIEQGWIDRTASLRSYLRDRVRALGYRLHDIDRRGDKGFHRIDEGFTTRPDSRAMIEHFRARGDEAMAGLFRPSSMEFVRSLGGDPFTLVSEMPLFVAPAEIYQQGNLVRPEALAELRALARTGTTEEVEAAARAAGVRPMPIGDQMRLQLEFLAAGLEAVARAGAARSSARSRIVERSLSDS